MKYDYRCGDCLNEFEVEVITTSKLEGRRKVSPKCPYCESKNVNKLIRPVRVIYKASGFTKKVEKK